MGESAGAQDPIVLATVARILLVDVGRTWFSEEGKSVVGGLWRGWVGCSGVVGCSRHEAWIVGGCYWALVDKECVGRGGCL